MLVTTQCASYCRYCTRSRIVGDPSATFSRTEFELQIEYLKRTPQVRDVLLSGGDPLVLAPKILDEILRRLREIPHIQMIRFHSRTPVVLPHRITEGLQKILSGFHKVPIWINIHCNNAKEITDKTAKAVYDLLSCGVSVGNQAVLLKGINDDVKSFRELHQKLLSIRVRPYYIFYCEPAPGIDHFRTPVEKGAELIRDAIRGHTTGLAQPMYVVATRFGKVPLMPDYYIINKTETEYTLRSYKGQTLETPNIPE